MKEEETKKLLKIRRRDITPYIMVDVSRNESRNDMAILRIFLFFLFTKYYFKN